MDRTQAIKQLEWLRAVGNHVDSVTLCGEDMVYFDMAIAALREQEQSKAVQPFDEGVSHKREQWISVKERLPEESGQYIVCCDDSGCPCGEGIWYESGVVVCAQVDVGINGGVCWEWNENGTLYDLEGVVTHWMPLPEPPKEGTEG